MRADESQSGLPLRSLSFERESSMSTDYYAA